MRGSVKHSYKPEFGIHTSSERLQKPPLKEKGMFPLSQTDSHFIYMEWKSRSKCDVQINALCHIHTFT